MRLLTAAPARSPGRLIFTYTGENPGIPVGNAPSILDRDYTITADITVPDGGAEGVIATMGGRFGGYGLLLTHSFNWWLKSDLFKKIGLGFVDPGIASCLVGQEERALETAIWLSPVADRRPWTLGFDRHRPVPNRQRQTGIRLQHAGPGTLSMARAFRARRRQAHDRLRLQIRRSWPGKGGTGVLTVDGKEVDRKTIPHTIPLLMSIDETFDIGLRHPNAGGLHL